MDILVGISESVFKDINIFEIVITPVLCMRYLYPYYNVGFTKRRKVNHLRNRRSHLGYPTKSA